MKTETMTEKESLALITEMISRTKERYIGDGNIMLMWGYLTVCVSALVWVMLALTHNPEWNYLWFLIWIVGGTTTPIMARKQYADKGMKSYSDNITSRIWSVVGWSAIGLTFCCLALMMFFAVDSWSAMFVLALIIVPFAEIAQGIVIREKSLVAGGSVGFATGLITMCCIVGRIPLGVNWFLPLFIVAFAAMMIVPGHILNRKAKSEK